MNYVKNLLGLRSRTTDCATSFRLKWQLECKLSFSLAIVGRIVREIGLPTERKNVAHFHWYRTCSGRIVRSPRKDVQGHSSEAKGSAPSRMLDAAVKWHQISAGIVTAEKQQQTFVRCNCSLPEIYYCSLGNWKTKHENPKLGWAGNVLGKHPTVYRSPNYLVSHILNFDWWKIKQFKCHLPVYDCIVWKTQHWQTYNSYVSQTLFFPIRVEIYNFRFPLESRKSGTCHQPYLLQ
jgi:hypothetical protein